MQPLDPDAPAATEPVPPAEQDEQARHRLLRAAVEVFDRKGYAAASVREIVERAGFSKPALYYHFHSKEGLLLAIMQVARAEFEAAVKRGLAATGSAEERLTRLCEEVYKLSSRNVPVVRVAHAVAFAPPGAAPPIDFSFPEQALGTAVQHIVETGVAAGELRAVDVGHLGMVIMAVVGECIHREMRPDTASVGVDGLRRILGMIFEGVAIRRQNKENGRP
jgi:TetR/AcrR family transcriptional regulator